MVVRAYRKQKHDISSMYQDARQEFQTINAITESEYYYFVVGVRKNELEVFEQSIR